MSDERSNKSKRAITTSEIARLSGVSRSSVSAVLNGKRNVRESTRRKVLECIREQNCESGMIARSLVGELSRTVTVLAANIGSPYHAMFFRGISNVLGKEGYHILFHNVRPEDQEDPETLANLSAYRPAGYIVLKGAEGPNGKHARRILDDGIPLVSEAGLLGVETHRVAFDNRAAMRLAADYVIEQGHVRLGHIGGPAYTLRTKLRKTGIAESLIEHDIPLSTAVMVDAGETAAAGYEAALDMLRDPKTRPTALLCFNDMVALGAYRAAHELGLAIPRDLSVVGFEGIDFVELMAPPLTTVDVFPETLGRKSAELLLKAIQNKVGRECVAEHIEPKLVIRESVCRLEHHLDPPADADVATGDAGAA